MNIIQTIKISNVSNSSYKINILIRVTLAGTDKTAKSNKPNSYKVCIKYAVWRTFRMTLV